MVTADSPSTSPNRPHSNSSCGVRGGRPVALTVTSGAGSAARSTLPLTFSGSASRTTNAAGTMESGRVRPSRAQGRDVQRRRPVPVRAGARPRGARGVRRLRRLRCLRRHVGDQPLVTGGVGADEGHRLGNPRQRAQRGLDLAQFDAEAAQLDLVVGAAEVLDAAVRAPTRQVSGAVHALAWDAVQVRVRVGDEPARRQRRAAVVAAGQLHPGEVQLARRAGRARPQPLVQDVQPGAGDRPPDGHRTALARLDRVVRDVDGGLGRPVQVVQARPRQLRVEALRGLPGQRLAAAEDAAQALAPGGVRLGEEDVQHRRYEVGRGDGLLLDDAGQVGRFPGGRQGGPAPASRRPAAARRTPTPTRRTRPWSSAVPGRRRPVGTCPASSAAGSRWPRAARARPWAGRWSRRCRSRTPGARAAARAWAARRRPGRPRARRRSG